MTWDWTPGAAIAALGSYFSWRVASAKREGTEDATFKSLDKEDAGLRQDIRDLRDELRSTATELRSVGALALKLQASQDVVNVMTAKALEGISRKQDEQAATIASHGGTLELLSELLKKKGMLE